MILKNQLVIVHLWYMNRHNCKYYVKNGHALTSYSQVQFEENLYNICIAYIPLMSKLQLNYPPNIARVDLLESSIWNHERYPYSYGAIVVNVHYSKIKIHWKKSKVVSIPCKQQNNSVIIIPSYIAGTSKRYILFVCIDGFEL